VIDRDLALKLLRSRLYLIQRVHGGRTQRQIAIELGVNRKSVAYWMHRLGVQPLRRPNPDPRKVQER
jgi:DNA-directed RNA polymerase specialized sigma24 family protein